MLCEVSVKCPKEDKIGEIWESVCCLLGVGTLPSAQALGSQWNLLLPLQFVMNICQPEKQTGMLKQRHKMGEEGMGTTILSIPNRYTAPFQEKLLFKNKIKDTQQRLAHLQKKIHHEAPGKPVS